MYRNILLCSLLIVGGSHYSAAQTCPGNRYNANQAKDISTCLVWGNYNIKTFDDYGVNFKSDCTHTMTSFKIGTSEFRIDIGGFNDNCRKATPGCHTFINILYNQVTYKLDLNDKGTTVFSAGAKTYPIPTDLDGLRVHQPGSRIIAEFTKIGVVVKWNERNTVEITVENDRGYKMLGLCGNNDKCSSNDHMLPNGVLTPDLKKFAEEWQVDKKSCKPNVDIASPCGANKAKVQRGMDQCQIIRQDRFAEARKLIDPELYFQACVRNHCACRSAKTIDCLCDTLDAFVKASNNAGGKPIPWRDNEVCPFGCIDGLTYFPCRPPTGGQTCTDIAAPQEKGCEEGCYCLPNTFFFQGKCYTKKKCPCVYGNQVYQPGDTVQQVCHTCVCTDGRFVCPDRPPCVKTASCVADPHYTTFDGKRFDFMGKCSYYLVKGPGFSVEADHYVMQNGQFVKLINSSAPSWVRKVTTRMGGYVIEFNPGVNVVVNNVKITRFPHKAGRIVITQLSSSIVAAELPNDVTVQWDGYSLVRIAVPDTLEGQVMGLFGTYTDDPNDDFMTPTGEIVKDPLTFGNSWKTESSCPDQLTPTPHPCDVNPGARPAAEKICGAVKGDIFARCNITDINTVYDNCVYDTCLCQDNPNKCSCDNIEVAAEVCSRQGINTEWRKKIPECAMQCPAGLVYQECGDSCARTCEDLSMRENCFPKCVEGCNCAAGTTMDESGRCIPIKDCKCRINNIVYPPGFQYLKSKDELRTCENARWTKSVPTDEQLKVIPTEKQLQERCSKFDFMDYTPCQDPTPKTCQNKNTYEIAPIQNCKEGCQCTDGFVLDEENKSCVRPEECPCLENGQSYKEGDVVVKDGCNRCVCMADGVWECKKDDCSAHCTGNEIKEIDQCISCLCDNEVWQCSGCKTEGAIRNNEYGSCHCKDGQWRCTEWKLLGKAPEGIPKAAADSGCCDL